MASARHDTGSALLARMVLLAAMLVVIAPMALFLSYGFFQVAEREIVFEPTLGNFAEFVSNESYLSIFLLTMRLAAEIAIINTAMGFCVAYAIWRAPGRAKQALLFASAIPLLMSYVIKIYAVRSMLGYNGLINGTLGALGLIDEPIEALLFNMVSVRITLSIVLLPFAVLPSFVALERIQHSLLSAASDLGATSWQRFRTVVVPMAMPGVALSATFTFVLASGDFLVPELVGGVNGFTFGRLIFTQFGLAFNWPLGAAMSAVLLLIALSVIIVAQRISNPKWQMANG